jgi:protein TonB
MQPQQIATADLLDILFEKRNKLYGAYPLRKEYNRRLTISLLITGVGITLIIAAIQLSAKNDVSDYVRHISGPVILEDPNIKADPVKSPPPPPPPSPAPRVAIVHFTTPPRIVQEADPLDAPPEQKDMDDAHIGLINQAGEKDPGIEAPPLEQNNGVIAAPVAPLDNDSIFRKVEVESNYPGGMNAWMRYLIKTLHYPEKVVEQMIQGTVMVEFIVDASGTVSKVEAISGPEELKDEAVRVIRKSGKWTPAIQNGREVRSYKKQGIVFRLAEQ